MRSGEGMDRSRFVNLLDRGLLLFLLSVVLVFGFWEHRNFYQVGLYNLLLLGGFATFLVLMAFRLVWTGELPRLRVRGTLSFSPQEGDLLLRRAIDLALQPLEAAEAPIPGQVVRATYDTGREFGKVVVLDATRKFLADVTEEEARRAGFRTAQEMKVAASARWHLRDTDLVTLLGVRPVGGRP